MAICIPLNNAFITQAKYKVATYILYYHNKCQTAFTTASKDGVVNNYVNPQMRAFVSIDNAIKSIGTSICSGDVAGAESKSRLLACTIAKTYRLGCNCRSDAAKRACNECNLGCTAVTSGNCTRDCNGYYTWRSGGKPQLTVGPMPHANSTDYARGCAKARSDFCKREGQGPYCYYKSGNCSSKCSGTPQNVCATSTMCWTNNNKQACVNRTGNNTADCSAARTKFCSDKDIGVTCSDGQVLCYPPGGGNPCAGHGGTLDEGVDPYQPPVCKDGQRLAGKRCVDDDIFSWLSSPEMLPIIGISVFGLILVMQTF